MARAEDNRVHFPAEQRQNLLAMLMARVSKLVEEDDIASEKAFSKVAIQVLGYEDSAVCSDGPGDFGIDYWNLDERSCTLFQIKSHDFSSEPSFLLQAAPGHISDLPRILQLINDLDKVPKEANRKVKELIKELKSRIDTYYNARGGRSDPFPVTVFFVTSLQRFTPQAKTEFDQFAAKNSSAQWGDKRIKISFLPVFVDDLIAEKWRETNDDWRTANGAKEDRVLLDVCGQMIESPKSLVFFTKAIDLVSAFDDFGYQIFEPNVRCELKKSRVNDAIKDSVASARGRREFVTCPRSSGNSRNPVSGTPARDTFLDQ